jgi:hypothetical protein
MSKPVFQNTFTPLFRAIPRMLPVQKCQFLQLTAVSTYINGEQRENRGSQGLSENLGNRRQGAFYCTSFPRAP